MKTLFLFYISFATISVHAQNTLFQPTRKYAQVENAIYEIYHAPHRYTIANTSNTKSNEPELKYNDGRSAYGFNTEDKELEFPEMEIYHVFSDTFT